MPHSSATNLSSYNRSSAVNCSRFLQNSVVNCRGIFANLLVFLSLCICVNNNFQNLLTIHLILMDNYVSFLRFYIMIILSCIIFKRVNDVLPLVIQVISDFPL
ncbi:transmembrane protein, putative [Medicago truncatula]|uniref:Transmembrane protein, putative n=1 Tax=Medicago truncatula TaxID=3880 RepID=A0A072UDG6_MEDTR|nr:transmembrane protein, putative [Medicago truncatula]